MASKKNLNVNVGVDLVLDAKSVELDQSKVQKNLQRELNKALKGVTVRDSVVKLSPDIALDRAKFARHKKALQKEANDYLQALNIRMGSTGTDDEAIAKQVKHLRKQGVAVSKEAEILAKRVSERTLSQMSEASRAVVDLTNKQREFANVAKRTQRAYEKSLNAKNKLTGSEMSQLGRRASSARELQQAQAAFRPLTKSKDFFTSDNQKVRQAALSLSELQKSSASVAGQLTHLNKVLNTTATAATKKREEDKKSTAATKARTKAENEARAAAVLATRVYRQQPKTSADVSGRLNDAGEYRKYLNRQRAGFTAVPGEASDRKVGVIDNRLGNLKQRTAELKDLDKSLASTGTSVKQLGGELSQTSLLIRQFFRYAIGYGVLYKMLGAVQALTTGILDLDKALFSIKAITASTTDQMTKIKSAIKEVAIETKFSTTEVAKAAQTLAQAGVDPDQINSVLNSVANFAAGTETSIAIAADLVSTMRNVFKELDDLTISNQLTKAVNISKLTGEDLKTILGISAQVVKRFNISSEQYLSAVTTLRNAGLKASTVATGLRQGLLEIFSLDTKSLDDFKQRYDEIGESFTLDEVRSKFFAFTQEANPLVSVLRELKRLGFSGSGRKTLARSLDIRAANAVAAMVDNLEELEKAETRLTSGNAALDASATQMDSLSNSIDVLGAAMTVLAADITEGPVAAFEDFVDAATEVIKMLDELHVKSLAAGGDGLAPAMQLAFAGGVAGASLPGSPAARALRGTVGAGLGGAAGVGMAEADDQELVSDVANAALLASILVPMFGGLGKAARNGLAALKGKKRGLDNPIETTGVIVGFFALVRSGVEAISSSFESAAGGLKKAGLAGFPSLIKKVGVQALKFGGWIGLAASVAISLFDIFGDDSDLKKQKDRVEGLKRRAAKQNLKVERLTSSLSTFKGSNRQEGFVAASGSEAERVETLQEAVADYNFTYDKLFGGVDESRRAELEKLFVRLSTTAAEETSPERLSILAEIEKNYGVSVSEMDKANKAVFLKVVSGFSETSKAVATIAEEYTQRLDAIYGKQDSGEKLTEVEDATLQAYEKYAGALSKFREALAGDLSGISQEEFLNLQADMLQTIHDLGRANFNAVEEEVEKTKAVTAQIDAALSTILSSEELAPGEVQRTLRSLLAGARGAGDQYGELLRYMVDGFESVKENLEKQKAILAVETRQADRAAELAAKAAEKASGRNRAARIATAKKAEERSKAAQSKSANLDVRLSELSPALGDAAAAQRGRKAKIATKTEDLKTSLRSSAEFLFDNRAAIATTMANELATNQSFAQMFGTVVAAAAGKGVQASGIVAERLSVDTDEGGLLATKAGNDLIKLVKDFKVKTNKTAAGTKDRGGPEVRKYVRDVKPHKRLAELDVQIEKAQKNNLKSLVDLNDATNPLVEQRNLLVQETREQLALEAANIVRIKENYEESGKSFKERKAKDSKLNAAYVRVANLKITQDKYRASAEKKSFSAKSALAKKDHVATKKLLDAKLEAVGKEISAAVGADNLALLKSLQEKRVEYAKQQVDADLTLLNVTEDNKDTLEQIKLEKLKILKANEDMAKASESAAISDQRLEFAKGGFTTRDQYSDAYIQAAGSEYTREEQASSVGRQQQDTGGEIERLSAELAAAVNGGVDYRAIKARKDHLKGLQAQLGALNGEYDKLTRQATIGFQNLKTLDPLQLATAFQQLDSDITKLADNINNKFVTAVDSLGEALVDAAFEGENLAESVQSIFYEMAKGMATDYINTALNEALTSQLLDFLPPTTELVGDVTDTAQEAAQATAQTTAITTAIATGNAALAGTLNAIALASQTATGTQTSAIVTAIATGNAQLLLAQQGTTAAILTGETADATAGIVGAVAGAATAATGKTNIKVRKFAEGTAGIISGPGTGTSDSIPGVAVSKRGDIVADIAVSDGESILTAKATKLLGANFINRINADLPVLRFASGAVFGRMSDRVKEGTSPTTSMLKNLEETNQSGNQMPEVNNSTRIINVLDPKMVGDYMNTSDGERTIVNVIQKNAQSVKRVLG